MLDTAFDTAPHPNGSSSHFPPDPAPFRFADDSPIHVPEKAPVLPAKLPEGTAFAFSDAPLDTVQRVLVEHIAGELDARFAHVPTRDEMAKVVNEVVWDVVTPLLQSVANLEASNAVLRREMGELLERQTALTQETLAIAQPLYNSEQLLARIDRLVSEKSQLEAELESRPVRRSFFWFLFKSGASSSSPTNAQPPQRTQT